MTLSEAGCKPRVEAGLDHEIRQASSDTLPAGGYGDKQLSFELVEFGLWMTYMANM